MESTAMLEAPVLISDLEVVRSALNAAYMQSSAQDLSDQYRKLSSRVQYSAMTKALEGALSKVEAYLNATVVDDESNDGA